MKVLLRLISVLMVLPAVALIAFSSGCGGPSGGAVSVQGKVTYKGQPVTGGKITLYPKGKEEGFTLGIDGDGNFAAGDMPKDMVGTVTVAVDTKELKDAPTSDPGDPDQIGKTTKAGPKMAKPDKAAGMPAIGKQGKRAVYVQIPPKYADPKTSGLTLEIKAGKNDDKVVAME